MTAVVPQMRDQFRAHLAWIDTQLGDERPWLPGESPSLLDINAYMNLWFVRANLGDTGEMVAEFDHVHTGPDALVGSAAASTEMSTAEALAIAAAAKPETEELHDPNDPNSAS
jgi:glutathione S-transferase